MRRRLGYSKRRQAGETLIEALLALSIFGAAAITMTRTMNEGYSRIFSSGQQSQVQSIMNGQLTIIRAAHDRAIQDPGATEWSSILGAAEADVDINEPINPDGCTYSAQKNRIYFDTSSTGWPLRSQRAVTAEAKVAASSETPSPDGSSLWIEVVRGSEGSSRAYYDFYVKACWSDGGDRQQKSVLRLYDLTPTSEEMSLGVYRKPDQYMIGVANEGGARSV